VQRFWTCPGGPSAVERAPLERTDHTIYERSISKVRSSLGEISFQKAWAEGEHIQVEQAIVEALSQSAAEVYSV